MDALTIEKASVSDAERLLQIYTPYIEGTCITFEITVPTVSDFTERIKTISQKYPYFIAKHQGQIIGYAYASAFKGRAAYDWSVETSIYVDQSFRHGGVGHALYQTLEEALRKQHIVNVCACITYPNPESIGFHQTMGYETAAHLHQVGFKFQEWHDVVWMEKFLDTHRVPPLPFIPYPQIMASQS